MSLRELTQIDDRLTSGIRQLNTFASRLEADGFHGYAMMIREIVGNDLAEAKSDLEYLKERVS